MSWKKTAAVFMTVLCISGGASAYDLQSIAKAHLPPAFTYQDIPEQQELKFHDFTIPITWGSFPSCFKKAENSLTVILSPPSCLLRGRIH